MRVQKDAGTCTIVIPKLARDLLDGLFLLASRDNKDL